MATTPKPTKGQAKPCQSPAPPVPTKGGSIPVHPRVLRALSEVRTQEFLLARLERGSTDRDSWSFEDDTEEALIKAHQAMLCIAIDLAMLRATSQREDRETTLTPSFEDFARHLALVMEAIHGEP